MFVIVSGRDPSGVIDLTLTSKWWDSHHPRVPRFAVDD